MAVWQHMHLALKLMISLAAHKLQVFLLPVLWHLTKKTKLLIILTAALQNFQLVQYAERNRIIDRIVAL